MLSAIGDHGFLVNRGIRSCNDEGSAHLAKAIVGNPDDTEETIRGNFQWFYDKPVDSVMPQYITPYPGTDCRKELTEEGLVVNKGGMDNEYGGWSTYNGEFAQCKTRTGLSPEEIEAIAYEECIRLNRNRQKKILKGELNFAGNNPKHLLRCFLQEGLSIMLKTIKRKNLSPFEKAEQERERKIAMNKFDI